MLLDISRALRAPGEEISFLHRDAIPTQEILGETVSFSDVLLAGHFSLTGESLRLWGELTATAHGHCAGCLRAVDQPLETVIRTAAAVHPQILQLHGTEDNRYISHLREQTGLVIWKAFRIRNDADLAAAMESSADVVLLDNGYGTGQAFDWSKAVEFSRPFILAGGLTPENISEAVSKLHPLAVDLSSGVEQSRMKNKAKILAAVRAAHGKRTVVKREKECL